MTSKQQEIDQKRHDSSVEQGHHLVLENSGSHAVKVIKGAEHGKKADSLTAVSFFDSNDDKQKPVVDKAGAKADGSHLVKKGETVTKIVEDHLPRFDGESLAHYNNRIVKEVNAVAKNNHLGNPDGLQAGQSLDLKSLQGSGGKLQQLPSFVLVGSDKPDNFDVKGVAVKPPVSDTKPDKPGISDKTTDVTVKPEDVEFERPRGLIEISPTLKPEELVKVGKELIDRVGHNGSVTRDDLVKALDDPTIKGKDAQALAAMYHSFGKLKDLGDTDWFFQTPKLSKQDLDGYGVLEQKLSQSQREVNQLNTLTADDIKRFDRDKGGTLSDKEITLALNDQRISIEDKACLLWVKQHYSKLAELSEQGVDKKAIDTYLKANLEKDTNALTSLDIFRVIQRTAESQSSLVNHDLFADKANPTASISPDAIRQGMIGNCYFLATLASVAKSNPESIRDAIKDNKDGTYTVTFPGDTGWPVTVKAPTEAEQGLFNGGSPYGTWANVMEKAYGQYLHDRAPLLKAALSEDETPSERAGRGGYTEGALLALVGGTSKSLYIEQPVADTVLQTVRKGAAEMIYGRRPKFDYSEQADIHDALQSAFSGHPRKSVMASTPGGKNGTPDGFPTSHAYSITDFKSDNHGGGMITIRNPWGGGENTTRGTITIPLDKFVKNFSRVTVQA